MQRDTRAERGARFDAHGKLIDAFYAGRGIDRSQIKISEMHAERFSAVQREGHFRKPGPRAFAKASRWRKFAGHGQMRLTFILTHWETPFDRFELVALASIDAPSVVRSQISLSELKAMGKPFINVMLGR